MCTVVTCHQIIVISHVINLKISKLICNIFHFINCVFDIDMHIGLCIELVVFEIKLHSFFYCILQKATLISVLKPWCSKS